MLVRLQIKWTPSWDLFSMQTRHGHSLIQIYFMCWTQQGRHINDNTWNVCAETGLVLTHLFDRWGSSFLSPSVIIHYNTLYVKSQGFLTFPFASSVAFPPYLCTGNCSICECAVTGWPCNARLFLLSPQGRIQIENGALSIAALNLSDSGMYQCVAENKHGVIYSSAQLMVLGEIAYIPPLLSFLSVCVWSSPKIKPSRLVWISSATILQTLLLSVDSAGKNMNLMECLFLR